MNDEIWVVISGFEGLYEVSNIGRVRSIARSVHTISRSGAPGFRTIKSRILTTHTWGADYPGLSLVAADKSRVRKAVHQLVAEAFLPNPKGFKYINHLDCDQHNPAASNLEWCTQSRNISHAYAMGRRKVGKEHHFALLPRDKNGFCTKAE